MSLPAPARAGLIFAFQRPKGGVKVDDRTAPHLKKLEKNGLGEIKNDLFHINRKGVDTTHRLLDLDTDAALFLFNRRANEASRFYKERVGNQTNNKDRIKMAENSLKVLDRKDTKIRTKPTSIPSVSGNMTANKINRQGKNAIYKTGGRFETGKMAERDGKYYAIVRRRPQIVDPMFD